MTALADALLAAQRQAIAALEKAYVAGDMDAPNLRTILGNLGATDTVDQSHLLNCLDVLRTYGAPAPSATRPNGAADQPKPMSPAQRSRIERDCKDRGWEPPDFAAVPLTMPQASEIIQSIADGTYDPARWRPPF